ncbi:MAG: GspE/PulE family protein [Planctomycetota bacterium]
MREGQSQGRLLGQILKAHGKVGEAEVQRALADQRKHGGLIGQCLVALGACTEADVAMALADQAGLESVHLARVTPTQEAIDLVDGSMAHTFLVLPLERVGDDLVVALADPLNQAILDDLGFGTGCTIKPLVAPADALRARIREIYGDAADLASAIADAAGAVDGGDAQSAAQSKPVVRLLNSILTRAIRDRASDVHFEVYDGSFRIRYRVDGALYEVEAPPMHLAVPLVARIKVMADLDITETRVPQDGRIELSIDGQPVDLRVATLPTQTGEGCVMRVLDRSAVNLDLSALGMRPAEEATLRALTRLPHGIVLVTGPTGSGKTTTLYAMLSEANDPAVKIITVEDPVEYDLDGIVQVPIQEDIGVTYAKVLRTILRQDPDKILVGEIRDDETASTAVEASLTGHTVFATLHTQDAPGTVTRLVDMGVPAFLITATLEAVVAQRLVRQVCSACAREFVPDEELLAELGAVAGAVRGRTLRYGAGCDRCHHTGYKGRMGIFEILIVSDTLRTAIHRGASTGELRTLATSEGMRTLRQAGMEAVLAGQTTLEEVLRETQA